MEKLSTKFHSLLKTHTHTLTDTHKHTHKLTQTKNSGRLNWIQRQTSRRLKRKWIINEVIGGLMYGVGAIDQTTTAW